MSETRFDRLDAAKPMIECRGVHKHYGDYHALRGIDLTIRAGEFFSLLGPSGCGKTTLLRLTAGFEVPDSGTITLGGQVLAGSGAFVAPEDRNIGIVFQSYALFPHMTVEQNIAFGLKQDGLPKAEIEERVKEMLGLVQMTQYAKRKPHQLSGGQRQRVALARSLAKRPKLLLLDEPMGALDKKLRSQMQLELVQIIERVGVTCVMVTHDQEEAMTMAERIAIMHQGWIAQVGSPMDIYETPASRLVCEFIGNVNLFEGELVEDMGDHAIIASPGLDNPIYVGHGISTRAQDKHITYALRPEKLLIGTELPELERPGYNWAKGVVHDIAYLGGHSVYYIKLPSGGVLQAFMANAERHVKLPTWEEEVYVYWWDDSGVVLQA